MRILRVVAIGAGVIALGTAGCSKRVAEPPRITLDLWAGQSTSVKLKNGAVANVELLGVSTVKDSVRNAVRETSATVKVNGKVLRLGCGNYHVPADAPGVRIDCSVTRAYRTNASDDKWALEKDARLRICPSGNPLLDPNKFAYPVRQIWFANDTQMGNEPVFVDGGEEPGNGKVYYHAGLDIGGCEGMTEVVSATAGTVIQLGETVLKGYEQYPLEPRYESVYVLGEYGWVYRYSHLTKISTALQLGGEVKRGQHLGYVGKEGDSGGWAHLHFQIFARQPSGRWGTEDGYAYLVESYLEEYQPPLLAVVRPHKLAAVGETVSLDARQSLAPGGGIGRVRWTFHDGSLAEGPTQQVIYDAPGTYSEVIRVEDANWNVDYDFAVVQVLDPKKPELRPPSIHAAYHPTFGIKVGAPVTFKVRSFNTAAGGEVWDFGDGTPKVTTNSKPAFARNHSVFATLGLTSPELLLAPDAYAQIVHVFPRYGRYIVKVERTDENGFPAIAHLDVDVGRSDGSK